jgi:hypothetical protein
MKALKDEMLILANDKMHALLNLEWAKICSLPAHSEEIKCANNDRYCIGVWHDKVDEQHRVVIQISRSFRLGVSKLYARGFIADELARRELLEDELREFN